MGGNASGRVAPAKAVSVEEPHVLSASPFIRQHLDTHTGAYASRTGGLRVDRLRKPNGHRAAIRPADQRGLWRGRRLRRRLRGPGRSGRVT